MVVGFEDPYLYGGDNIQSIKAMAGLYAQHLLASYGDAEYKLIGASFGSIVAAEMACYLTAHHKHVDYVGILDGMVVRPKFIEDDALFKIMSQYDYHDIEARLKQNNNNHFEKFLAIRQSRMMLLEKSCGCLTAISQGCALPSRRIIKFLL